MWFTEKLRLLTLIACAAIASGLLLSNVPQQQVTLQGRTLLQSSDQDRCPLWKPDLPALEVVGIPNDVCNTEDPWKDFGHMAWQTFKTLVWPAAGRGVPDKDLPIGHPTGSRVFETYKADWETFLDKAARPEDWQHYPKTAPVCANADTMTPPLDKNSMVLASLHKFGNLDQVFDPGDPPLFHILVTQKRTLVRYLTGFGEESFNTILKNELYKPQTLKPSDNPPLPPRLFKPGPDDDKTVGSINIKSAWIEMDGFSDEEKKSFHTRMAWVQDPPFDGVQRNCKLALVGLVALHVAHKTKSSPQWIWASFEHRRNVPDSKTGPDGGNYTFHNGLGKTMDSAPPPEAQLSYFRTHPFEIPKAFNVVRKKAIPRELDDINKIWQEVLKNTVWKNYDLVAIQWPRHRKSPGYTGADEDNPSENKSTAYPQPPCVGFHEDSSIANSVIETFLQADTDCIKNKKNNPTCMSCHNFVRNYDFVWSIYAKDEDTAKSAISVLRQGILSPQQ